MTIPIVLYGDNILRKKCEEVTPDYPDLSKLIENMFDTMYKAKGVGLAAPQVAKPIRLFIVDTEQLKNDEEEKNQEYKKVRKAFINPTMIKEYGNKVTINEGCLSIPDIREDVERFESLEIEYYDENFVKMKEHFTGFTARVIQHEYDHVEGILFIDKIKTLRKQLIKGKLDKIQKRKVHTDYKSK